MENETASSYYEPMPGKVPLSVKLDLLGRIKYWKLAPILKLIHGRSYERQAINLIEIGQLLTSRAGVPLRYEIKNGLARFDISPDKGKTYLNYLQGNISGNSVDEAHDVVNSIATIEAMIKTKAHLIY